MNIPFKLISEYNQTNQTYRLVICVYILLCVSGRKDVSSLEGTKLKNNNKTNKKIQQKKFDCSL